jgi:hypothetical protein
MNKTTNKLLFTMVLMISYTGIAQTLNQNAMWPNAAWTVTGTYNTDPLAFEANPTVDANFAFDDDDAGAASDDNIAAESPVIDLTAAQGAGETWITVSTMYVHRYLPDDELVIQYWDTDGATWINWGPPSTASTAGAPTNDYCSVASVALTTDVLNIIGFTATQLSGFKYRISYDDNPAGADYNYGFCFSSPTIISATPPSCPDPSVLTVSNVTDTTAGLAWTENGLATAWDIEIVTTATPPTGTATATVVSNPYTVMGLIESTEYDYYVRANCGVDGTSTWIGPLMFRTACAATASPYIENFETFTTAGAPFTAENCWTGTGGAYYWESAPGTDAGSGGTGPDPTITTGNYFYTEASGGVSGNTTDLVSPLVDLTALTAPALTFNYHMFGGQIGTLDILVNGTTNVWTLSGQQQVSATDGWELAVVDLDAYTGQTISITIRATSAGTYEGDISIDNIAFGELPACAAPSSLTVTSIDSFSADLGWTENGTASLWNIELVDITGGGTATGTATASGVVNPYMATGLTQNNDYTFYVQADCGTGGLSGWSGPFAFTTPETCPAPGALTATTITDTTADLGWTENGAAMSWNIELVDITGGGTATGAATASGVLTPYGATGLVGANTYEFYVQADCGVDGVSAWAGPYSFATTPAPPTCASGTFLDSGGPSGNYSSGENITYTICPDNAGDVVTVDFTSFSTESNGGTACYDGLTIHDGADNTATTIDPPGGGTIWCWDRNLTPALGTGDLQGMMITSSDASGCLTFVFTSDGTVTREGWEAMITCGTLSTVDFDNSSSFTYYPNPVKSTLTLNAKQAISNVVVFNMLGQEMIRTAPNTVSNDVDMANLQSGAYFVQVTIGALVETIRVIKN